MFANLYACDFVDSRFVATICYCIGSGIERATAAMYVTFVLRALGYEDGGNASDFSYAQAVSFGIQRGLVDERVSAGGNFTRGDAAIVSENALSQFLRTGEKTLYESLQEGGALKSTAYWNAGQTALAVPVSSSDDQQSYVLSRITLQHFFPDTAHVLFTSGTPEDSPFYLSDRYSREELRFIEALSYEKHYSGSDWVTVSAVLAVPGVTIYLTDSQYEVLGWCRVPDKPERIREVTFKTATGFDGATLSADYHRIIDTVAQNWDRNQFELGEERYAPRDDGTGISYIRPVKRNGNYVDSGWYCIIFSYPPGNGNTTRAERIEKTEQVMATVFFFSDRSLREYQDSDWTNRYISDSEFQYPKITEPGAPASRGIRIYEHSSMERVVYFFTRDGVYLGRTSIPASR